LVPEYNYHIENPMFVIVNGVEVLPEKIENGKVTLSNPLTAGIEVVCVAYGRPDYKDIGCVNSPYEGCSDYRLPSAEVTYKAGYFFNMSNSPETCTVLGVKLKRMLVTVNPGEAADLKIRDAVGFKRDVFVVNKGRFYLPYMYNGFPAVVGYNTIINSVPKHKVETVIVESPCIRLNDRFFPDVRIRRGDFFALVSRIYENLHNRFTDRPFSYNSAPQREITDKAEIEAKWYGKDVLTLLDEKFHDGCYAFPLYIDGKFEPESCITRAEAVTFLNKFIEMALEKFR
jgi:hypothetical protein